MAEARCVRCRQMKSCPEGAQYEAAFLCDDCMDAMLAEASRKRDLVGHAQETNGTPKIPKGPNDKDPA